MVATAPKVQAEPETISHFLVIGYGNERRGDNGVGPWVAKAVADWNLPSVKTLAVPQLSPELTAEMAKTNHVIFVDACSRSCAQTVQIDPLVICPQPISFSGKSHHCDPCTLLKLTHAQYGSYPCAWLLQVAAARFDLGCALSDTAKQGGDRALQTIAKFFKTYQQPKWGRPTMPAIVPETEKVACIA